MRNLGRRVFLGTISSSAVLALAGCTEPSESEFDEEFQNPRLGDDDAPELLVFEDMGCPNCQQFHKEIFTPLQEDFVETGEIQYVFHDFVIPADNLSEYAHNLLRAVQDVEGTDAFWEFKSHFYENVVVEEPLTEDLLHSSVNHVSDSADEIIQRAEDNEYADVLIENEQVAASFDVTGTPGFHINGNNFVGPSGYSEVAVEINSSI